MDALCSGVSFFVVHCMYWIPPRRDADRLLVMDLGVQQEQMENSLTSESIHPSIRFVTSTGERRIQSPVRRHFIDVRFLDYTWSSRGFSSQTKITCRHDIESQIWMRIL